MSTADPPNIRGAVLKVSRANKHLDALTQATNGFLDQHPYQTAPAKHHGYIREQRSFTRAQIIEAGVDPNAAGIVWNPDGTGRLHVATAEVVSISGVERDAAPVLEWGVWIGEVVNNLRSALDNLVWSLSCKFQTPPVAPTGEEKRKWRSIAFPVIEKRSDWHSGLNMLWVLPDEMRARIEHLQPFYCGEVAGIEPTQHPLAILDNLWQEDKHHVVRPLVVGIAITTVATGAQQPETKIIESHFGPFVDGAELAKIAIINPDPRPGTHPYRVDMEFQATVNITFEEGPPAYGGQVWETLDKIGNSVSAILAQFQSEFP